MILVKEAETLGSTGNALHLLKEVIYSNGAGFNPERCSSRLGVPVPTLYRHIKTLLECGMIIRVRRGEYLPHPSFLASLTNFNANDVLAHVARPELEKLAKKIPATLHFGVFESEMVTYLVKVSRAGDELFTKENMQLEAYCSGIGRVLLATLPTEKLNTYFSGGPFPKLTSLTETNPGKIRQEIQKTLLRGFGIDDREIDENLICLAVPVISNKGDTLGAISAASKSIDSLEKVQERILKHLKVCAERIGSVF